MPITIRLDGTDIADRWQSAGVVFSWDGPHAEITINSDDDELWPMADPATGRGTARIVADWGDGVAVSFLLESREGEPDAFILRGRTLSALATSDYADPMVVTYADAAPATLADLVQAHTSETVTWAMGDYAISELYVFGGYPIDGVRGLAEMFGGVVQPGASGGLTCTFKHPFAPSVFEAQAPDLTADWAEHVIDIEHGKDAGPKYDSVIVRSPNPQEDPVIEQESGAPISGIEFAYVRIYWPEQADVDAVTEVTAGSAAKLTTTPLTHQTTERVKFVDGFTSVRYPVYSVDAVEWVGATSSTPTADIGSKGLKITDYGVRIADVTYSTKYDRYSVSAPAGVDTVSVSWSRALDANTRPHKFTLTGEPGTTPAEPVEGQWLSDPDGRQARGARVLYDSYDHAWVRITVPDWWGHPRPGMVFDLTNVPDLTGNWLIEKAEYSAGPIREDWRIEGAKWSR